MSKKSHYTKLGSVVQIRVRSGELIRGCIIKRANNGITLTDAYVAKKMPKKADFAEIWAPCLALLRIPFDNIASIQIIKLDR
jgi:hypothetical protein